MASNRNFRMLKKAMKGEIPAPFSKNEKENQDLNIRPIHNEQADIKLSTASVDADRPTVKTVAPVYNRAPETHSSKVMSKHARNTSVEDWVDATVAYQKSANRSSMDKDSLVPILVSINEECSTKNDLVDSIGSQAQTQGCESLVTQKDLVPVDNSMVPVLVSSNEECSTKNAVVNSIDSEAQSQGRQKDLVLVVNSTSTQVAVKKNPSLKISLLVNETIMTNLRKPIKQQEIMIQDHETNQLGRDIMQNNCSVTRGVESEKTGGISSIEDKGLSSTSSVSTRAEKVSVPSLKSLSLKIVIKLTTNTNSLNGNVDDQDSCEENDDFSGTDDDGDFVPNKNRKRKLVLSGGSKSSASSTSVTSSSSSSSTSGSSIGSTVSTKKGKKRARNVQAWKRNKVKLLRNSGKQYVSRTGKTVKAREMKPPCSNKCRLSCATKFTTHERQTLFENFWALSSLQRQRDYLSSSVTVLQVSVRRLKTNTTKERRPNCCFSFLLKGKTTRVCKTFLLNTLGITERTLRTVVEAKSCDSGCVPNDRRGKHIKTKMNPEVAQSVHDHINSIPRVESHYIRANTSREFIDGGLTIAEMHRHYKEQRDSQNKDAAKYDYYANIFNTKFNISFFTPKKDQCDVCEEYKNATGPEKLAKEEAYKEHQKQKELSRKEKARDIKACEEPNSTNIVAIYDLQAIMPVPIGESSAFFYKSKLNCYNFTVTDVKNKKTTCYFWHEALGGRGAIEIGTSVFKFLENIAELYPISDVTFYSDNCCGQQKNKFILAMYHYAVSTLNINSVTHKFLVRGHTQNEGDNAHSVIEKAIKRAKKSGPIYVPSQYAQLIRTAKKTGKVFEVQELNYDDFIDLKAMSEEIGMNSNTDVDGNTVKITEIRMVRFVKNSDTYEYKTSYEEENWTKVPIKIRPKSGRKSRKEDIDIQSVTAKPAYKSKIAIGERKKKDLLELISRNIVPKQYKCFYDSIL